MIKVKLSNYVDFINAQTGLNSEGRIRQVEVEMLVDTGAIGLALPQDIANELGLLAVARRRVRVADGRRLDLPLAGGVMVELLGRSAEVEALILPVGSTPLFGAVPLELMDLVVIPATGEVITNPAHPDGPVVPLLRAS